MCCECVVLHTCMIANIVVWHSSNSQNPHTSITQIRQNPASNMATTSVYSDSTRTHTTTTNTTTTTTDAATQHRQHVHTSNHIAPPTPPSARTTSPPTLRVARNRQRPPQHQPQHQPPHLATAVPQARRPAHPQQQCRRLRQPRCCCSRV
jgi:hypothetical protein